MKLSRVAVQGGCRLCPFELSICSATDADLHDAIIRMSESERGEEVGARRVVWSAGKDGMFDCLDCPQCSHLELAFIFLLCSRLLRRVLSSRRRDWSAITAEDQHGGDDQGELGSQCQGRSC